MLQIPTSWGCRLLVRTAISHQDQNIFYMDPSCIRTGHENRDCTAGGGICTRLPYRIKRRCQVFLSCKDYSLSDKPIPQGWAREYHVVMNTASRKRCWDLHRYSIKQLQTIFVLRDVFKYVSCFSLNDKKCNYVDRKTKDVHLIRKKQFIMIRMFNGRCNNRQCVSTSLMIAVTVGLQLCNLHGLESSTRCIHRDVFRNGVKKHFKTWSINFLAQRCFTFLSMNRNTQ